MSLFDAMFELSDAQDISQATGTVASANIIDFVTENLEIGAGQPYWLNVRIEEAFASAGTANLAVALCYDTAAPIDSSSTVIYTTPAIDESLLVAGAWILRMPLPYNVDEESIVGLLYTIGGTTSTVGTINAWLDNGPQSSYDVQVAESNI